MIFIFHVKQYNSNSNSNNNKQFISLFKLSVTEQCGTVYS